MSRLTWSDLLIDDIAPDQFRDWLAPWLRIVAGRVAPAFVSKFGSLYLRRPEGPVDVLDAFTGVLSRVTDSYEEFIREVNQVWWQETYLLSKLILELHEAGKVPVGC